MPAENVAYLGRSLFTDYLLAVELGGTLLLVATIGAIAIASRRAERDRDEPALPLHNYLVVGAILFALGTDRLPGPAQPDRHVPVARR